MRTLIKKWRSKELEQSNAVVLGWTKRSNCGKVSKL